MENIKNSDVISKSNADGIVIEPSHKRFLDIGYENL